MDIIHASRSDRLSGTQRWVADRLDERVEIALLFDRNENNMGFSQRLKMSRNPSKMHREYVQTQSEGGNCGSLVTNGCRPLVVDV